MERCPNCRARLDAGDSCRRCGLELAGLRAVEQAHHRMAGRAAGHLAKGEMGAAIRALIRAQALCRDPLVSAMLALARTEVGQRPAARVPSPD
jgi:hypothetical protein